MGDPAIGAASGAKVLIQVLRASEGDSAPSHGGNLTVSIRPTPVIWP
jgi:hypothetical protein